MPTLAKGSYYGDHDYESPGNQDVEKFPFRLIYADHVPVDKGEWQILECETFEDAAEAAHRRADKDLKPDSGVYDNLFFIMRWDGESWDHYDPKSGEDYTDIAFEEVEV